MSISKPVLEGQPYFFQFMMLVAIIAASVIVCTGVGLAVLPFFFDIPNLMDFINSFELQLQHIDATIFLQIVGTSIGLFLLPPLIFSFLMSNRIFGYFQFRKNTGWINLIMAMLIIFSSGFFIQYLIEINSSIKFPGFLSEFEQMFRDMQDKAERMIAVLLSVKSFPRFMLIFTLIAILPAIGEELLFRGVIQRFLYVNTKNAHLAIITTSLFFGIIHLQFFNMLALTFMGVVLGYLYYWSKNLWVPIFAHFFHNGLQVCWTYLYNIDMVETHVEEVETLPLYFIIPSGIVLFVLLFFFRKRQLQNIDLSS